METIKKIISINAPKNKVWEVLVTDTHNKKWYAMFSEGSYAETDWQQGSRARFTDASGTGMLGWVAVSTPHEKIVLNYDGVIINHKDVYEGDEAEMWKGTEESYTLEGQAGATVLTVETKIPQEYYTMFSHMWDDALKKVKEIAEAI